MRLLLPTSHSVLLFAGQAVPAQTADDFFNSGAQLYISNNIPDALKVVQGGRKLYVDDVKLKKLEELLKQQQQQNQNQQNQRNRQQQQNKQNSSSKQNQPQPSPANGQNQSAQPDGSSQGQNDEKAKEQAGKSAAREMSPEEAKRLLDAQKGDE